MAQPRRGAPTGATISWGVAGGARRDRGRSDFGPRGGGRLIGRITLGLYNCYDPKRWHDIMRITLARVGPVAMAFDCDVATFGFPFEQARERRAKVHAPLRTPADIAAFVAGGTSIGEGGEHFEALVRVGRFQAFPYPVGGFPSALGPAVATTPRPDPVKAVPPLAVARDVAAGEARLLVYGLGPRGLPAEVLEAAPQHLEITGKGVAMETATALGALPAMLHAHLQHLGTHKARSAASAGGGGAGAVPR